MSLIMWKEVTSGEDIHSDSFSQSRPPSDLELQAEIFPDNFQAIMDSYEDVLFQDGVERTRLLEPRLRRSDRYSQDSIISGDINVQRNVMAFLDADSRLMVFAHMSFEESLSGYVGATDLGSNALKICFLNDKEILSGHADGSVLKTDLVSYTETEYVHSVSSIRCIRKKTSETFVSGDHGGAAVLWDVRKTAPAYVFAEDKCGKKHARRCITSVEFSEINDYLVYTSESPGGTVGCWDLRYTERGKVRRIKHGISERLILDMCYDVSGLFGFAEDGRMLEMSDLGVLRTPRSGPAGERLFAGSMAKLCNVRMMAAGGGENLVLLDLETRNTAMFRVRSCNGILPASEELLVSYGSDGHITEYMLYGR